jgi:isoleucyl-tRNA synthetase
MAEEIKPSMKDTLNLPRTDFPMRPNFASEDVAILERWEREQLYQKAFSLNEGKEKFVLHVGPPYANGSIHIGHAYSFILKDIVAKSERMSGKHVPVTPGWDCHGLPIEIKVAQDNKNLSREAFVQKCREYAAQWVGVQREQFKHLGIVMDWARPYITMDYGYESRIIQAFASLVDQGYVYKRLRTVPWCASCQTVLATAEIEYQERKDPSIYVLFSMVPGDAQSLFPEFKEASISFVVWTTTPWTLPLNRAVVLKPDTTYDVLEHGGKYLIVGSSLSDALCHAAGITKHVVKAVPAEQLRGIKVYNPLTSDVTVPVILDDMVLLDEGTACVHSAPGCGPIDYEVAIKNGLEVYSPLSSDGKYLKGIIIDELEGMPVVDGQIWVIKKLAERGTMLFKTSLRHQYPHCWRCHQGLIYRATSQWFCDLSHNALRERVLAGIKDISFVPGGMRSALSSLIEGRMEWCLSRQRQWGVPIPALLCSSCGHVFISAEFVRRVAAGVSQEGVEYWIRATLQELAVDAMACPECKKVAWEKEHDILDVWFDSGVTHFAVLQNNQHLGFPADVYLEGKDQARGWFQSSLLTSHIIEQGNCTKQIISHGFIVDGKGQKMSKSIGNVVSPDDVVKKMGTDGLRLWATTNDLDCDAVLSNELLDNVEKVFRKIRNTCRFLLSNVYDFDIDADAIEIANLRFVDRYALAQLCIVGRSIELAYRRRDFNAVYHMLSDYCTTDLSALYLDIIKDRLYVEAAGGKDRRSAQTACWYILDTITRLMAPVLSFTAEQVSDYYQSDKTVSIHLQTFADIHSLWTRVVEGWSGLPHDTQLPAVHAEYADRLEYQKNWKKHWDKLFLVRDALLKSIERQREQGLIKHPYEARLTVYFDQHGTAKDCLKMVADVTKSGQTIEEFFKEILVVSQFVIVETKDALGETVLPGLFASVERARGTKCPRCWQYFEDKDDGAMCVRCERLSDK